MSRNTANRWLAVSALRRAKYRGLIDPRPPCCAVCGVEGRPSGSKGRWTIGYHHPSYAYTKLLHVVPLCDKCHRAVHRGDLPDPKATVRVAITRVFPPTAPSVDPLPARSSSPGGEGIDLGRSE